jgi:hypothetical protein
MEYRILNHLANPVGEVVEYGGEKVCTVSGRYSVEDRAIGLLLAG